MVIKAGETITVECKVLPKRTENFYPRITMKLDGNPDVEQITIYGSGRAKASDEIINGAKTNENVQLPPKSDALQTPPDGQKQFELKKDPVKSDAPKTEAPKAPEQQKPIKK
jgi:hypothetical protein